MLTPVQVQREGGWWSLASCPHSESVGLPLGPAWLPSACPRARLGLVSILSDDQVSAILQKHLFLPFHPQKMESSLPCLTREQRFPLLALRPCEPRLVSPLGCTCTWSSVYGTRAGCQPAPFPFALCIKSAASSALSPERSFCVREAGQDKG